MHSHLSNRRRLTVPGAAIGAALLPAASAGQDRATPDASLAATPVASPVASALDWSAVAEEAWTTVRSLYLIPEEGLYRENHPPLPDDRTYSYLWPFSALLSSAVARAELAEEPGALDDMVATLDSLEAYWDGEVEPNGYDSYVVADGGGDKFYDDNEWLGQDFVHAYRLTGDRRWLDKAEIVWAFVISGWSDAMGGGIYWKQYDISTKNTTSNAPAAILALMLHQETGDRAYLDWALRILDWVKQLKDPVNGVYWDNLHVEGRINETTWTYNTGTPMHANALLYEITGEQGYLDEARSLAAASYEWFAPPESATAATGNVRHFPKEAWFNTVLFRGYVQLLRVDPEPDRTFANGMLAAFAFGWENARTGDGLVNPDWSNREPAPPELRLLDQATIVELAATAARVGLG